MGTTPHSLKALFTLQGTTMNDSLPNLTTLACAALLFMVVLLVLTSTSSRERLTKEQNTRLACEAYVDAIEASGVSQSCTLDNCALPRAQWKAAREVLSEE